MDAFTLAAKLTLDSSAYDQGLRDARDSGSKLGGALKTAFNVGVAAVTAATTAVTTFAGSAVKTGMGFDAAMSQVAAISGATGEDFDLLREKAQYMGATTKFSASEAADAMNYMAMAGWEASDMLDGIEGIMNLAAASGEDLATTSDIVTDALTAFGLKAEDSGRFADVLAAASSSANTNVSLMGETFKYVAPVAGALQYSIEDTATAIGLMANAGIKGSMAGTALRSMLTRMAKPTKESQAAMDALGVSLSNDEGEMYSLAEVMEQLRAGFSEGLMMSTEEFSDALMQLNDALDSGEISNSDYEKSLEMLMERAYGAEGAVKAEYAAMLGGQQAMSGLLAIVNASDDDFKDLTEAIYGSSGAADEMSKIMQNNLQGDITILKSAFEGLQIAVSDKLTPSFREFVQFGSKALSTLTLAFQEGGVEGVMDAFGQILTDGMTMIVGYIPDVITAGTKLLQALIQGVSDNLDLLTDTALEVTMSLVQFLLDNLPDIIKTGLDILVALAQGIADNLDELVPTVIDVVLEIVDVLTDPETLGNLVDASIAIIIALANGLIDALPKLIEKAPEIIENLVVALIQNVPKLLTAAAEIIIELVKGIWNHLPDIFEAAGRIIGELLSGMSALHDKIWEAGADILNKVWEGLQSLNPWDWGKDLISNFVDGIKQGWESLKSGVSSVAQGVKNLLGFSEPKEGPLSDFHTYAPDMMKLFAEGIRDNEHLITDQIKDSFDFGDMTIGTADIDAVSEQRRVSVAQPMYNADDLATAIREALAGAGVYMDGRLVGQLVTNYQRSNARAVGA